LNVSEQKAEPTSDETGTLGAGPAVPASSDTPSELVAVAAEEKARVEAPDLAPGQGGAGEAPKADAPKVEASKVDVPKVEAPKVEAPKVEAPKVEAQKADAPGAPGKLMIMSSGDRAWGSDRAEPEAEAEQGSGMLGKRRVSAMAAVVALATVAGALGGALATTGFMHFAGSDSAMAKNSALEAQVARIEVDILGLKGSVENTSKMGVTQFNKTSDRLDKVEKAQAEPAAKLAKLSEAVEKLRAASPAAPAPVAAAPAAAREVTGSIAPPATAAVAAPVPLPVPKPEVARLPTVEGWVLRDVANGGALIEGRQGIYEVYAGDPVPGLGRVDAIRKQDGRWVVVTSKGLIVAR
jgi:hypothetical protein